MESAVEVETPGSTEGSRSLGCVYVLEIGTESNLYKTGKAKNYEDRLKAHRTMSVERLTLYAEIETDYYAEVETYLKHLLQGHRWVEGEGKELYHAERDDIDAAIAAARHRATVVLPRMEQAAALTALESDGTVMTPDAAITALHRERLRLKQAEWEAKARGRSDRRRAEARHGNRGRNGRRGYLAERSIAGFRRSAFSARAPRGVCPIRGPEADPAVQDSVVNAVQGDRC